jgi:hypothetical protein
MARDLPGYGDEASWNRIPYPADEVRDELPQDACPDCKGEGIQWIRGESYDCSECGGAGERRTQSTWSFSLGKLVNKRIVEPS